MVEPMYLKEVLETYLDLTPSPIWIRGGWIVPEVPLAISSREMDKK